MSLKRKLILFCILAALTASSALMFDRYQQSGPELLSNPLFKDGLAGWQIRGNKDGVSIKANEVSLTSSDPTKNIGISQTITVSPEFSLIRLRGIISSTEVKPGKKKWHRARFMLVSYDQNGKWLPGAHEVIGLSGSNQGRQYNHIFAISPEAHEIRVVAQLAHCTGTMTIKNLSLQPVSQTPYHPYLKWSLLCLWAIFLSLMLDVEPANNGRIMKYLVYIAAGLIIIGTFIPAQLKEEIEQTIKKQSAPVTNITNKLMKQSDNANNLPHNPEINIDKLCHFFFFAIFACLRFHTIGHKKTRDVLLEILILACASELMQLYAEGRSAQVTDVLIDCAGGMTGIILASIIRKPQH